MKFNPVTQHATRNARRRAFTIIEIALCLGIIGFALVAILHALPFGLSVQRENREQTIINQEAAVWMDTIRSGAHGYDDLTNYVISISNVVWHFQVDPAGVVTPAGAPNPDRYYYTNDTSTLNGTVMPTPFLLTNGEHIVGLLSTPKIVWTSDSLFNSNYITSYVRAMSGAEVDKAPQTNTTVLADAFSYKLIAEIIPYVPLDPNGICFDCPATNVLKTPEDWIARTNLARTVQILKTNSHDMRLTFLWPILPNGDVGNNRQTFRTLAGGGMTNFDDSGQQMYFIQPSTYVQVK